MVSFRAKISENIKEDADILQNTAEHDEEVEYRVCVFHPFVLVDAVDHRTDRVGNAAG